MRPAEKVERIKNIASVIGGSSYDEIDFLFRQFGIPIREEWSGSQYDYVINQLEQSDESNLIELYEYLVKEDTSETNYTEVWKKDGFKLFLSHITEDKQFVSDIKKQLNKYSILSFVAHEDIEPTKEWINEIESALETCDALAAFLSPNFHKSLWTDQEIGFCIKRRILIIPIKLKLDPYGFISKYQAVQGKNKDTLKLAEEIFNILLTHDLTSSKLSESLVMQFENSDSFAESKRNIELLEKITSWTPQMLSKIENSIKSNRQIKHSWGVPQRVSGIIKQYGK